MPSVESVEDVVYQTIRQIAEEESIGITDITDDDLLVDKIGLKSLHIARILAVLEIELGIDPFSSGELAITSIRTVGDLCDAYDQD